MAKLNSGYGGDSTRDAHSMINIFFEALKCFSFLYTDSPEYVYRKVMTSFQPAVILFTETACLIRRPSLIRRRMSFPHRHTVFKTFGMRAASFPPLLCSHLPLVHFFSAFLSLGFLLAPPSSCHPTPHFSASSSRRRGPLPPPLSLFPISSLPLYVPPTLQTLGSHGC